MLESDPTKWTVPLVMRSQAERNGDAVALHVLDEGTETYAELYESALRLASGLAAIGVQRGDKVIIMAENGLPAVHSWLAVNFLAATEVTINTAYRGPLLAHAIRMAGASVMILEERFIELLEEVRAECPDLTTTVVVGAGGSSKQGDHSYSELAGHPAKIEPASAYNDVGSIIYTSGTSGPAKGVMLTHAQNYLSARHAAEGLRLTKDDIYYCAHPLFHMAGKFLAVYAALLVSGRVALDTGFRAPDWVSRVTSSGATVTVAHGPMLEMIFAEPERPEDGRTSMTRVLCCPLPRRIAEPFEQRFDVRAIEAYGMTEIGVPCWCPYDEPLRVGSCGRLLSNWFELRIADPETDEPLDTGEVGQILIRPRFPWTTMQGYIGMPEKTVESWRNLWFQTGDSGYVDAGGYYYFVDRLKDRIRRRAESISSYDIESVALAIEGVVECAAIGVPSEFEHDDDIKLCVVLEEGAAIAPEEILRVLVGRLPHYMVPRYLEFLEALPRTPTNKVQKARLRQQAVTPGTWDRKRAGISLKKLASEAR